MADDPNVPVKAGTEADNAEFNAIAIDDFAATVNLSAPEAGQTQEARDILESIDKVPHNVISLILINSALGEVDETFHWMEVARESKLPWYPWFITWFPFMDEVRDDPRMKVYAEELGLEDVLASL